MVWGFQLTEGKDLVLIMLEQLFLEMLYQRINPSHQEAIMALEMMLIILMYQILFGHLVMQ